MLPATIAQDIRQQVLHYLEATFNFRRHDEEDALRRFISDPESGLFKGPWLQVRRPFRPAADKGEQFFDFPVPFLPFRHQWLAWQRLTSKSQAPRSTLVTTGTGSGKTECFLFPILDHCFREHLAGRKGIKAIILYPMNALAADQAGRFAEEIFKTAALCWGTGSKRQARLRVGLYTGRFDPSNPNKVGDGAIRTMSIDMEGDKEKTYRAITDQQAMQDEPPDILLTNYKMLDFLLMRPKDKAIWRHNEQNTLRFLVLDELHTYDGAQGADVACLIRRLKERLGIAKGDLCCVGTSATVAAGEDEATQDPLARLADFAGRLFEEDIKPECVIGEDRLTVEEIIHTPLSENSPRPLPVDCIPNEGELAETFAQRIAPLFGGPAFPSPFIGANSADTEAAAKLPAKTQWALALGQWLKSEPLFLALLQATRDGALSWRELVERLSFDHPAWSAGVSFAERSDLLSAFIALVAQARELRSGRPYPMTPIQVQLWVRELRRLGRFVSPEPAFGWLDDKRPEQRILPVAHCTECGESVWVALVDPDSRNPIQAKGVQGFQLVSDIDKIYQGWGFERAMSDRVVVLSPWHEDDEPTADERVGSLVQGSLDIAHWYLAKDSLVVRAGPGPCPLTGESTFRVKINHDTKQTQNGKVIGAVKCPHCLGDDSLMFIGARAATIGSVAIDEMFGSVLNNDPKLLAFTDSVQDASHRAGFFSARTYHFTLRTGLQRVIDEAGTTGVPLAEVGKRLLDYWSQPMPGRPGSLREAISTLLPTDLREYQAYLDYRSQPVLAPPGPRLRNDIEDRLTWEAISEFSLMLTHGRTLEGNASTTLGYDREAVDETLALLRSRLPSIDPALLSLDNAEGHLRLRRWLLGILHRQRERGGMYHPYVDAYARQGYWGKYPFGRVVAGRELHPPAGRYRPRFMAVAPHRDHDHVLAPSRSGQLPPWQIIWATRALEINAPESSVLDLIRALLDAGCESGLLKDIHHDGGQRLIAISPEHARLYSEGVLFECSYSGARLFRPVEESNVWEDGPTMAYRGDHGFFHRIAPTDRQIYYQKRYRKGALRRVFAREHTGLLTTEERESLEYQFNHGGHADDPNVLTATSTLEMGIDIGDLSSTMLCSIPPTTASYLQRIGRAGRSTGTALVLAVINQRPHDLFFFGRPQEMLAGTIEPPGCWLDASAVIVRQYLAFCFDSAVKLNVVEAFPATGKQLVDDLDGGKGPISAVLAWMAQRESALQTEFLARFKDDVRDDTRERFQSETRAEVLRERIHAAARDFDSQRQAIANAQKRLADQKKDATSSDDKEAIKEIEQESKILRVRQNAMSRTAALGILIEYGLLPNYAFPERGVHFNGVLYNEHRKQPAGEKASDDLHAYDIVRGAGSALRELAPRNRFYTHSREFEIQQLSLGTHAQPLLTQWAICGECGHMRRADELNKPDASPVCPQCGYAQDAHSQLDLRQRRQFLEFSQSQAISYMEHYESLSGDRADEREQRFYRIVPSFDATLDAPSGAVANESAPFGIEYRAAFALRQINTGFADQPGDLPFGVDQKVSEGGFSACAHCGITLDADGDKSKAKHRRSCSGRRKTEKMHSEGRQGDAYQWESFYLYRELRSEAIRILLPEVEEEDIATLTACIHLGLRLRFQGNPAHLMVIPQVLPQHKDGIRKNFLVLMDSVPGGTGFLKTLFQDTGPDKSGLPGEGIMDILRRAKDALESCHCRLLSQKEEMDGCYRCIRTYHLQYRADMISRERGIKLLDRLIDAGAKRSIIKALDHIDAKALFGSLLEKRFVDRLRDFVEAGIGGQAGEWSKTIIKGAIGFRFRIGNQARIWELELQPKLGPAQGVAIPCQPDFLLSSDDPSIRPLAIFADGFEPHVQPNKAGSRLPDDMQKRRAILASGAYCVWAVSWNDLNADDSIQLSILQKHIVEKILPAKLAAARAQGGRHPDIGMATSDGFRQLKAFLLSPERSGWSRLANEALLLPLQLMAGNSLGIDTLALQGVFDLWKIGADVKVPSGTESGTWVLSEKLGHSNDDLFVIASSSDAINGLADRIFVWLRLPDSKSNRELEGYVERWRRFLALTNLFQFCDRFRALVSSEADDETVSTLDVVSDDVLDERWKAIQDDIVVVLSPFLPLMAAAGVSVPQVEVYLSDASECFAEIAWFSKAASGSDKQNLSAGTAILVGDQVSFAGEWQQAGWSVITLSDIQAKGVAWLLSMLPIGE